MVSKASCLSYILCLLCIRPSVCPNHIGFLESVLALSKTNRGNFSSFEVYDKEEFLATWLRNMQGLEARPFSVSNLTFLNNVTNSSTLALKYGHLRVGFQLMSDGSREGLPYRGETLKLSRFLERVLQKTRSSLSLPIQLEPPYLHTRSTTRLAQQLYEELNVVRAIAHFSPMYAESYSEFEGDSGELTATLIHDGVIEFPKASSDSGHGIGMKQVFTYIGGRFTGSFIHKHMSACASSTGKKLWMLYTKDVMERLTGPPNLPDHLPRKCPSDVGGCIEGIHPLEVLQHYAELHELGLAPMLHVQQSGDVFCFPDDWYHGTINLEDVITVSWLREVDDETFQEELLEDNFNGVEGPTQMSVNTTLLMKLAQAHLSAYEYLDAIRIYRGIIVIDDENIVALGKLGISLYKNWLRQRSRSTNTSALQESHMFLKQSLDLQLKNNEPFDERVHLAYIQTLRYMGNRLLGFHHMSLLFSRALINDDMDNNPSNAFLHSNFILSMLREFLEIALLDCRSSDSYTEYPPSYTLTHIVEWIDLAKNRWGYVRSFHSNRIRYNRSLKLGVVAPRFMHHYAIGFLETTNVAICEISPSL